MRSKFCFISLNLFGTFLVANCINNYCDPKWCPSPFLSHTACKNTGQFNSSICTKDAKIIKLSKAEKQFMLDLHNQYRMILALGLQQLTPTSQEYFPEADRMMELTWDEEQAFMASLQLKTCVIHDSCRNTIFNSTSGRLLLAGQNIFYFATYGERYTISRYLELAAYYWFDEYQVTPMNAIKSLYFPPNKQIGHFTQMIHDRNYSVGCAVAQWTEEAGKRKLIRVTCNYPKGNYGKQPVYNFGNLCGRCKICDEDVFYGLCLA